jgi:hypothetical protein
MQIDLSQDEAMALRGLLEEKVRELDTEINRADSLRFKEELRNVERKLEHILGTVSTAMKSGGPADWEPRDNVTDEKRR